MFSNFLFDTNIIIQQLNDNLSFKNFKKTKKISGYISTISIMEFFALAGMGTIEEEKIRPILNKLKSVPVTESIAERAGYFARTRPNRNNRSDLLIASTAIELSIPLLTKNIRDFKGIPGIQLVGV